MQFSKVDEMQIMFDLSGHWGNNGVIRLLFFLFSKNWNWIKLRNRKMYFRDLSFMKYRYLPMITVFFFFSESLKKNRITYVRAERDLEPQNRKTKFINFFATFLVQQ